MISIPLIFLALSSATTQIALPPPSSQSDCKPLPNSHNWPRHAEWEALNKTVEGRLLAPLPPAIVCDSSKPQFDNASCMHVVGNWFNSTFHADDPVSVNWPNWQHDGCMPPVLNATAQCDPRPFPSYVVDASKAEDVAAAVKFASKTGVRLVVKGTGHDFLGR